MSFLSYLGLDDLADDIREFTDGLDGLKQDIIDSVLGPGEELKNTVGDIANSITEQVHDTTAAVSDKVSSTVDQAKESIRVTPQE